MIRFFKTTARQFCKSTPSVEVQIKKLCENPELKKSYEKMQSQKNQNHSSDQGAPKPINLKSIEELLDKAEENYKFSVY